MSCTSWRAVDGDPKTGTRNFAGDLPCDKQVPGDASGYCECSRGFYYYAKGHDAFTCAAACNGPPPYQPDETTNIAKEYLDMRVDNKHFDTVARDLWFKRAMAAILLVVAGFFVFHRKGPSKSNEELYLERTSFIAR